MPPRPTLRPNDEDQRFLRRLFLVLVAGALVAVVVLAHDLMLLAFGSLLVSLLLVAVTDFLERRLRLPRNAGLALSTVLLFGIIGLLGYMFYAEIAFQGELLARELPRAWARTERALRSDVVGRLLLDTVQNRETVTFVTNEAQAILRGVAVVLFNLLIVLSAAVFFAADPARYRRGLAMLSPGRYRALTDRTLGEIGTALRLWLVTQSISMLVMGSIFTLGLWLSGVPAYVALGVFGGLAEFIPYVGPIIAMVPALLLSFAGEGSFAGVVATYAIARIVQTNFVTPWVTGKVVSVPPGWYIFLILGAGYVFGTFGLFFSGPLAIALYTAWLALYSRATLGDDVAMPGDGGLSWSSSSEEEIAPGESPGMGTTGR